MTSYSDTIPERGTLSAMFRESFAEQAPPHALRNKEESIGWLSNFRLNVVNRLLGKTSVAVTDFEHAMAASKPCIDVQAAFLTACTSLEFNYLALVQASGSNNHFEKARKSIKALLEETTSAFAQLGTAVDYAASVELYTEIAQSANVRMVALNQYFTSQAAQILQNTTQTHAAPTTTM